LQRSRASKRIYKNGRKDGCVPDVRTQSGCAQARGFLGVIGHKRERERTQRRTREREREKRREGKERGHATEGSAKGDRERSTRFRHSFATESPLPATHPVPPSGAHVSPTLWSAVAAPQPDLGPRLFVPFWDLDVCNSILLGTSTFSPFGTSIVVTRSFWTPRLSHQLFILVLPITSPSPILGPRQNRLAPPALPTFGHLDGRLGGHLDWIQGCLRPARKKAQRPAGSRDLPTQCSVGISFCS
jgi:hypothetical protein